MASQHGSRTRYNTGCRCDSCKLANREYDKSRRQKILASKHAPATVTALPRPAEMQVGEVGRVEFGIMAEIAELSTAAGRPGLVAIASAMAKVLDSPLAIAQHGSTGKALAEILDKIRKGSDSRQGKLASVRSMTRSTKAAG